MNEETLTIKKVATLKIQSRNDRELLSSILYSAGYFAKEREVATVLGSYECYVDIYQEVSE